MNTLKEFLSFVQNMRSLWGQVKNYAVTQKPTGAQLTSFLEQNVAPNVSQALQQRPEWQAAKRSTVDNQHELKQATMQTAANMPVLQGKNITEVENYVESMGKNLGFLEGGERQ